MELDKHGHKYLVEDEPSDLYGLIQSHADECKIEAIVERAMHGDPTALNKVQAQYADMTKYPKNLAAANNEIIKLKQEFEKLPTKVKQSFDNSYDVYIAELSENPKSWEKKMGIDVIKERAAKAHETAKLEAAQQARIRENLANLGKEKTE